MSLRSETVNVLYVLATPTQVFEDINRDPRWRVPFLFVMISSLAIGWLMIPAVEEPMRKLYARSFGESSADSVISSIMRSLLIIEMVVEPFLRIVRWLLIASVLYFLCYLLFDNRRLSFRKCFSIAAYSETILILMSMLDLFIIYARGLDQVENSGDLRILNKGLEFFLTPTGTNRSLAALLSAITLPSLLYMMLISIGVSVVAGLKRSSSLGIVGITWLFWVTVCAARPFIDKVFFDMIT